MPFHRPLRLAGIASLLALWLSPVASFASGFIQTNLVSDVPGLANSTDPNLTNPWGMASTATSPFWIADQASNTAALSDGAGNIQALLVSIPTSASGPQGP